MELKIHIGYQQILEMIFQLPKTDLEKLSAVLQSKVSLEEEAHASTKMQKLLLNAPTWTDSEYNNYLEAREHLNQFRSL